MQKIGERRWGTRDAGQHGWSSNGRSITLTCQAPRLVPGTFCLTPVLQFPEYRSLLQSVERSASFAWRLLLFTWRSSCLIAYVHKAESGTQLARLFERLFCRLILHYLLRIFWDHIIWDWDSLLADLSPAYGWFGALCATFRSCPEEIIRLASFSIETWSCELHYMKVYYVYSCGFFYITHKSLDVQDWRHACLNCSPHVMLSRTNLLFFAEIFEYHGSM